MRLTSPVPAFSSRRHVPAARRGSPPVSPPASHVALVAAVLAALALLAAAGCGGASAQATTAATGSRRDRPGPAGPGRPAGDGLRDRACATSRRSRSTRAGGSGRRPPRRPITRATACIVIPRAGATPVKVISGVKGPLGLLWHGGRLYVASLGRVDVFSELHGSRFARARRSSSSPPAMAGTTRSSRCPAARLVMGISAACDHCVSHSRWSGTIVSFRPDGSDVRRLRRGDPRALRRRLRQGDRGAADLDEPARRPRREDARRLARARPRRGRTGASPGCYGQGGSACAGVPAPLAVLDKHAAAGGVAIVSGQLGGAVGRAALVTEWERGQRPARAAAPHRRGLRERAGERRSSPASRIRSRSRSRRTARCSSATGRAGIVYRIARA